MDLQENPFAKWEDKADSQIPTATLQIYNEISEYLKGRNNENVFRASAATMCVKRRWFQKNGYPGSPLTPRKIINFMLGDLSERTLLYFIKRGCVGYGKLYSEVIFGDSVGVLRFQDRDIEIYIQKTLSFNLDGLRITGHADGFGKRTVDGKWELIEIKSAADYGFKSFQEDGPEDYLKQSHALMMTDEAKKLGIDSVRFFYLRKSTGHIWDRHFNFDPEIANLVKIEFISSNEEFAPPAPYNYVETKTKGQGTGKFTVPWQCQYCPYLKTCKGDYELEWKKDQFGMMKPIYLFKEMTCNSIKPQKQREVGTF